MSEIRFIVAGCGHIITADNIGGNCSKCGKLCCKSCLVVINDERLCPTCLKKFLKGENG